MDLKTVVYRPGPVARVILNRPEKLNAQSWTLLSEMDQAFAAAVADPECRVIVLSGEGRAFSAGHDLSSDQQREDASARQGPLDPFARGLLNRDIYTDSHLRWRDLPKPTIAMVHWYCFWGGWMTATAMDIIFAADDATFLTTYGDHFTTAWDVGPRKAKEILFGNRAITADEAMAWGSSIACSQPTGSRRRRCAMQGGWPSRTRAATASQSSRSTRPRTGWASRPPCARSARRS